MHSQKISDNSPADKSRSRSRTNKKATGPQTASHLKKSMVDLSKTKKRKEFEHDALMQQKLTTLLDFSQYSEHQMKQARKVGKKVINEIEAQIDQLLKLRDKLNKITNAKKKEIQGK